MSPTLRQEEDSRKTRVSGPLQRLRVGSRIQVACINCKERKLKCDDQVPACTNCQRDSLTCLIEDPGTKRRRPRNYIEKLEERVALLEGLLQQAGPRDSDDSLATFITNNKDGIQPVKPNEDDSVVSELAAKVGMLGLNAAGAEPHYLGSSSAFAFSRLIKLPLRLITPERSTIVFADENASTPSPCLLPAYDTAVSLSNAYFQNIHPQYPFLHEPTFRRWEMLLFWPSEPSDIFGFDNVPLFFINMVYAIGALLLPNSGSLSQQLYMSAQLYIDHVLSLDNLEAIQAILCCAMYSLRSPTGPSIWKLSGLALRQCIELGYHRSAKRFASTTDPLRLELRKRVFWCAYGIDVVVAMTLGRPLCLQLQEVDAEFPLDIDDSCIIETGIYGMPRRSSNDAQTGMSTAIHVIRLRCLWARIHTSIYSNTTLSSPSNPSYNSRIKQLRTELENWHSSAPPVSPRIGTALSIFATKDWYDMNYNHSIIKLYRGQITHRKGAADKVFTDCLQAATNVCHGYRRQYIGKPVNYTWGAVHGLFMAGLTYLHCLWTSPAVREAIRQDDVISTCTDCTIVLVVMSERWAGASPYRDIFEALAARTMTMMVDKNDQWWMLPTRSTLSNGLDQKALNQWMADIVDVGMSDGMDRMLTGLIGSVTSQEHDMDEARKDWEEAPTVQYVEGGSNC